MGNNLLKLDDQILPVLYNIYYSHFPIHAVQTSFANIISSRELFFFSVNPSTKPQILGTKPHYDISDIVNLTCKSAPSRPAAFLKWLVNGIEVEVSSNLKHVICLITIRNCMPKTY